MSYLQLKDMSFLMVGRRVTLDSMVIEEGKQRYQ